MTARGSIGGDGRGPANGMSPPELMDCISLSLVWGIYGKNGTARGLGE